MDEQTLSQREFDTWREGDDAFKRQILQHIQTQTSLNLDWENRITAVEGKQEECADGVNRRTTWISSVVSAIVGGLVGLIALLFGGRS